MWTLVIRLARQAACPPPQVLITAPKGYISHWWAEKLGPGTLSRKRPDHPALCIARACHAQATCLLLLLAGLRPTGSTSFAHQDGAGPGGGTPSRRHGEHTPPRSWGWLALGATSGDIPHNTRLPSLYSGHAGRQDVERGTDRKPQQRGNSTRARLYQASLPRSPRVHARSGAPLAALPTVRLVLPAALHQTVSSQFRRFQRRGHVRTGGTRHGTTSE